MPSYVSVVSGAVGLSLVLAILAPAPRIALHRAAAACRVLMIGGLLSLGVALAMPAFDVWYPAIATIGAALVLWFTMFWLARQPTLWEPAREPEPGDDDESGGGGGGGRRPEDPDPDPGRGSGPREDRGPDWEAFDRERRGWERERRPERLPVGV